MPMRHADDQLRSLRAFGVLSVAIPLLVALLFGGYRYLQAEDESRQEVDRSLRVAAEHASKVIAVTEGLQDRVSDRVRGRGPAQLRADEAGLHAMLVELMRGQDQIRAIWIVGPDGRPLASSRALPVPAVDLGDRDYFRLHARGGGRRHMSGPLTARGSGDRIIDFSLDFPGPDGRFGGVINIGLATSYLGRFYSDLASSDPGLAVAMFNGEGSIYARWPPPAAGADRMAPDAPLLLSIREGRDSGDVRGRGSDGLDRQIAWRRVSETYALYVGAGVSVAAFWRMLWQDLAVLLGLGLPPFAALWFTIRAAARRVEGAAESARRLEAETASRRRAEEALVQSQKLDALGRVAGGVAHEFNNVLMVISANVHLMKQTLPQPNKRLDSVSRAVDSATRLTRQLLSFTRRQALAPGPVDPAEALPPLASLLGPVLGGKVTLTVVVDQGVAPILVDSAELELALVNLAINSRDAMPEGGAFRLHARSARAEPPEPGGVGAEETVIEALDTGTGIAPADLDKVFDPFFTTREVGSGTGLGLTQVRGVCVRAGGSARVRSFPGEGTVVEMRFPALPRAGGTAVAADGAGGAGAMPSLPPGRKVLLVEDDDLVAEALLPMLESLGCAAVRVDRAGKALSWLDEHADELPDIVVSDVRMPGAIDGLGLARRMRQTHPALPLLLITGYSDALEAIEKERFAVLAKPCSSDALRAALARLTV